MQTTQGEQNTSGSTQIIVNQQMKQGTPQYVNQNCPSYAKYFGVQYWPTWAAVLGLIGFFCIIGGLQSIVTDCEDAADDVQDSCDIFETYIFFVFYLPNILIVLIGLGIACGAHYNQTGWVLKCCLPCAMVGLFIWACVICYILNILKNALDAYCSGTIYDNDYTCTNLSPSINTAYAGQVILLIYLVLVTTLGCLYACKYSNQNRGGNVNNGAPLVVVQTTAAVSQSTMYAQPQGPVVYQQGYPAQVYPTPQQGYPQQQQGYPQQGYAPQQAYPQQGYAPQVTQ